MFPICLSEASLNDRPYPTLFIILYLIINLLNSYNFYPAVATLNATLYFNISKSIIGSYRSSLECTYYFILDR